LKNPFQEEAKSTDLVKRPRP